MFNFGCRCSRDGVEHTFKGPRGRAYVSEFENAHSAIFNRFLSLSSTFRPLSASMAHSHPHQKQPQEYPSPLGNEHQCNEANSQAKALIQLAREAWYSLNPPVSPDQIHSCKRY